MQWVEIFYEISCPILTNFRSLYTQNPLEYVDFWPKILLFRPRQLVTKYLNYYLSFDVCVSVRVRLSEKKLFNGCTYQKMLVYKVVTFLKRIKMAVLFLILMDQIRPKWIKLDQT